MRRISLGFSLGKENTPKGIENPQQTESLGFYCAEDFFEVLRRIVLGLVLEGKTHTWIEHVGLNGRRIYLWLRGGLC